MEEDGEYEKEHVLDYVDLTEELEQPTNMYEGADPCLKGGVADRVSNLW